MVEMRHGNHCFVWPHRYCLIFMLGIHAVYVACGLPCDGISGGVEVGDQCIWLSSYAGRTQQQARDYCNSVKSGADLVVVDSAAMDTAIRSIIVSLPAGQHSWLGVYDRDTSLCRDWKWVNGKKLDNYIAWVGVEPNGRSKVNPGNPVYEGCVVTGNVYGWADVPCQTGFTYAVCQCCPEVLDDGITDEFVWKGPAKPVLSRKDGQCARKCLSDLSCCSFWYNHDTLQCEFNTASTETLGFIRENAKQP